MKHNRRSQLETLYRLACAKRQAGQDITSQSLVTELGVTVYGASCLLFMLEKNEFCPELEDLYKQAEAPPLKGKVEGKHRMVKFLEDMPPHKKGDVVNDLSEKDRAILLSMGMVRTFSFEEYRQMLIEMYSTFARIFAQHRLDILEAIAHKDTAYFDEEFADKSIPEIKERLKKYKLNNQEIKKFLKLYRPV